MLNVRILFDDFYTGENEQLKRNADLMKEKLKSHEQVRLYIFIPLDSL